MAAFSHNAFSPSAFSPSAFSMSSATVAVGDQIVTSWATVGIENVTRHAAKVKGTQNVCSHIAGVVTKETCING